MSSPTRRTHLVARVAAIIVVAGLAACSDQPTGLLAPDPVAAAARLRFITIADSLAVAGSDPAIVRAYAGIAASLASYEHVTPVRITLDGSDDDWLAIAREIGTRELSCPKDAICAPRLPLPPLVTVVAWQRTDARRVVQLTSTGPPGLGGPIGQTIPAFIRGPFLDGATLTYLDGHGGVYTATAGTQAVAVTHTAWACRRGPDVPEPVVSILIPATCTMAGMHAAFSAAVGPLQISSPHGNTATGEHRLDMAAQDVDGTRLDLDACASCYGGTGYPPSLLPPVNFRGATVLPALLHYTVDSVVTLTLDVVNPGATAAELHFTSSQQYDFIITPLGGGAPVWRWSADRGFAALLTTRTLAPGAHWIITERWRPTARGQFTAHGLVTSSSHYVDVATTLTVP